MAHCSWWRVWWHRRLRRRDRQVIWPLLRTRAARHHPDNEEDAVLRALRTWQVFLQQPGQAHWHCACAAQDSDVEAATHAEHRDRA